MKVVMCYAITATLVSFFYSSNTWINSSATGTMPGLRKGVYVCQIWTIYQHVNPYWVGTRLSNFHIIELVDSVCRNNMDTQYYDSTKKSLNLSALITMYRSSPSIFMTNTAPNSAKKRHESTKPESCQTAKMLFFLLLLLLDGLVQNSVTHS